MGVVRCRVVKTEIHGIFFLFVVHEVDDIQRAPASKKRKIWVEPRFISYLLACVPALVLSFPIRSFLLFDISDLAASQLIFYGQQVVQAADRGSGKGHHARSCGTHQHHHATWRQVYIGGFANVCNVPIGHQNTPILGRDGHRAPTAVFLIFRTLSTALRFLWFGAILPSVSC